ncbi:MAG TPA: acylphosphatase [Longimicrobiaceae bacterium]|nr:acylphosphatase [Longimicrobiaceae bacterium]
MHFLHVRVNGRVQGVGFRWFVREEARRLGLSGWVTNLESGDVEVAAGGTAASLERLRAALRVGPAGAAVMDIEELAGEVPKPLPYPFNIHR